ncbi:GntR family transcriptional regulator [Terrihabitans soli]|uniref:GntR family transcriptional regulator n=1 Tax=Terrihabitans soli TaxID=708113 RepID=A0A6S6QW26_9HYPH|nr:GntR family transcriptional regulator [Terrihabitans soli]BCJ91452.1 GntR family transcriptional regulator [Terrihabitans soli]
MVQRSKLRDALEEEIVNGVFGGVSLDEQELARRYGTSRTPIREALMQLSAAGLVEMRPRRGAVAVVPDAQRLMEMFEVAAEMEGMAARLAARRWTDGDRRDLLAAHADCRAKAEAGDADAYYYENEIFHEAIAAASHSGFLQEQLTALRRRLKPYRRLQLRTHNRIGASYAEHGAILAAIFERDAEEAERLVREHVLVQGDRFADLVASLEDLPAAATRKA